MAFFYFLFKIIVEFLGLYKKWDMNLIKYCFYSFEIFMVVLFIEYWIKNEIKLQKFLLIWCIFWVFIVFIYKILNYILNNFDNILNNIEKNKKIEKIFLFPLVNKIIYYFIWFLPWNLGYWIFFWWTENGWYLKVWFSSNRDIFFFKYFKWDSRDFFYNFNRIIFYNKFYIFLKYIIFCFFLRILMFFSFIRKNLALMSLIRIIMVRILIFCSLSFLYTIFFQNIILDFFRWMIIIFFIFECLLFIIIEYILKYLISSNNKIFNYCINLLENPDLVFLFIDPLMYENYQSAKIFFELNNTIHNIILGNSITLRILKKYMLWVNKKTEGFFFKNMNILPKKNIIKWIEYDSLPFDILPRTRYIIYQMRYNIYNNINQNLSKYDILTLENLYISYFEKTYMPDSSILNILFLLQLNIPINYLLIRGFYLNEIENSLERVINYILLDQKIVLWRLKLAQIHKKNPEILDIFYILNSFRNFNQVYNLKELFIINFFLKKKIPNINNEFNSLKDYKDNIKLLTNFILYEEEGIVWNENIVNYLKKIDLKFHEKTTKENFYLLIKISDKLNWNINDITEMEHWFYLSLKYQNEEYYKFKFNDKINLEEILINLNILNNIKIIDIESIKSDNDIYLQSEAFLKFLCIISIENINKSELAFLLNQDE